MVKDYDITYRDYFERIDSMRKIPRWSLCESKDRTNVAEHTLMVCFFVDEILDVAIEHKLNCLLLALVHDFGEANADLSDMFNKFPCDKYPEMEQIKSVFFGHMDVPHNIKKKYPEIKKYCDERESSAVERTFRSTLLPSEVAEFCHDIVKLADILSYTFEALKQISLGSTVLEYHRAIARGENDSMGIKNAKARNFLGRYNEIRNSLIEDFDYHMPDGLDYSY